MLIEQIDSAMDQEGKLNTEKCKSGEKEDGMTGGVV